MCAGLADKIGIASGHSLSKGYLLRQRPQSFIHQKNDVFQRNRIGLLVQHGFYFCGQIRISNRQLFQRIFHVIDYFVPEHNYLFSLREPPSPKLATRNKYNLSFRFINEKFFR